MVCPPAVEEVVPLIANGLDQLEAHVQNRLSGQVRDLQLLFRDNGLVIRGRCRTYYAKQLAQHAVMQACELSLLANEIEVS
jgi:hypothetical protein